MRYWDVACLRWKSIIARLWRLWLVIFAGSLGYLLWSTDVPSADFEIELAGYTVSDWRLDAAVSGRDLKALDAIRASQRDERTNAARYDAALLRGAPTADPRCQGKVRPAQNDVMYDESFPRALAPEIYDGRVRYTCSPATGRFGSYVALIFEYAFRWFLGTFLIILLVEVAIWAIRGLGRSSLSD